MTRNTRARCAARYGLLAATLLSGCQAPDPVPDTYVLGTVAPAQPAVASQLGQPVVWVEQAQLPDYLDTTDIVMRSDDNRVVASKTGRWGERLSVGVTRAIALALAARLPDYAVAISPPGNASSRQVRIEINSFAMRPDGNCVLSADWSIRVGDNGDPVDKERITLVVPVTGTGDAALVEAMSHEVDTLAQHIALALRPGGLPAGVAGAGVSNPQ
jgi:uncharacterized protein